MTEIRIRKYEKEDWAAIEEIHDAARKVELFYADIPKAFVPLEEAAVNEDLFDYEVAVALIENKVVGFIAYTEGEIGWLYVSPKVTRKGVAQHLIRYIMKNTAVRPIELEVLVGNTPAIHLYEKMGFEIIKTYSGKMTGNESVPVTVNHMQLKKVGFNPAQ